MLRIIFDAGSGELMDYGTGTVVGELPPGASIIYRNITVEEFQSEVAELNPSGSLCVIRVNDAGVPVSVRFEPTPSAQQNADARARAAADALRIIEASPLAYAILIGGAVSGYSLEDRVAMQELIIRWEWGVSDAPFPNFTTGAKHG